MGRVHARGARPARGLFAFGLAVFAAGCASSGAPEMPAAQSEAAGPVLEAPATATDTASAPTSPATATDTASATTAPTVPAAAAAPAAGIFSESQADRGGTAFDEVCADCHTTSEFRGRTFQSNWGRRTVYSFFRTVRSTMPDDNPGGLDEQTYLDVVSYILRMNGHAAGASEMTPESPMRSVRMAPPDPSPRPRLVGGLLK